MENEVIHRKAKFRYALCGAPTNIDNSTLDDNKVTCPKCLELLAGVIAYNENSITKPKPDRFNS
jgi:hypothetical protein